MHEPVASTACIATVPDRVEPVWLSPQVSDVAVASEPENGKFNRSSGTVEMPRYTAAVMPPSSWIPANSRPAAPGRS